MALVENVLLSSDNRWWTGVKLSSYRGILLELGNLRENRY